MVRLHLSQEIVERLDIASGRETTIATEKTAQGWSILLSFAPYESHLLRIAHTSADITNTTPVGATLTASRSVMTNELNPQSEWKLTAQQDNILRFGTFHFALDRENVGPGLRRHEGHVGELWPLVETRPFINQCADIAARRALPLQFRQSFGSPMHASLAYPLLCWYQTTFLVEQLPAACKLIMDEDAIGGSYILYLNGHEISVQDSISLFEHGYRQLGYDVQRFLTQGINSLVAHVEVQRDEDGVRDPL